MRLDLHLVQLALLQAHPKTIHVTRLTDHPVQGTGNLRHGGLLGRVVGFCLDDGLLRTDPQGEPGREVIAGTFQGEQHSSVDHSRGSHPAGFGSGQRTKLGKRQRGRLARGHRRRHRHAGLGKPPHSQNVAPVIRTTEPRIPDFDGVSPRLDKLVSKSQVVEQPDIVVSLNDHLAAGVTDRDQGIKPLSQATANHLEGHLLANPGIERKQVHVLGKNRTGDGHRQLDHLGCLHRRNPLGHRHLLLGHCRNLIDQEDVSIRQATLGSQPQPVEPQRQACRNLDVENRAIGGTLANPGRPHASVGNRDPQRRGQFQATAVKNHTSFLTPRHRRWLHPMDKRLCETG